MISRGSCGVLERHSGPRRSVLAATAIFAVAALLWLQARDGALIPAAAAKAAALGVVAVGFWAFRLASEGLVGLIVFAVAVLAGIAPPAVVLSGFGSSIFWLAFSSFVLSAALHASGLTERLSGILAGWFAGSYRRAVIGTIVAGSALCFVLPSAFGRLAILVPVVVDLALKLGLERGSVGYRGLITGTILGAIMPGYAILPANLPNVLILGTAEALYQVSIGYGLWFAAHAPISGLLRTALMAAIVLFLYPASAAARGTSSPSRPVGRAERATGGILLATLALWMTDAWHGISPGWVGLSAAIACLVSMADREKQEETIRRADLPTLFYVSAVMGLGAILDYSGAAAALGRTLVAVLDLTGNPLWLTFAKLLAAFSATGLAIVNTGLPAVLTPLAGPLAEAAGMKLPGMLMLQGLVTSVIVFPYQLPPMIIALKLADVPPSAVVRPLALLAGVTLLLAPLAFVWWRLLGLL